MPRGNRVIMLRALMREGIDITGETVETGYEAGGIYNLPPHMAKKLVNKGYARFYHAPEKT